MTGRHELGLSIDDQLSNRVPVLVSDLPTSQKRGPNDTLKKAELLHGEQRCQRLD